MKTKKPHTFPDQDPSEPETGVDRVVPLMMPAWQPDGPTLRHKELLKVIPVGRSTSYVLEKTDPRFPKGIPLFPGKRSPKFYWTREATNYLEWLATKSCSQRGS